MSASTNRATDAESLRQDILTALEGGTNDARAERIHHGLTTQWGMPEVLIGEGGRTGVPVRNLKGRAAEDTEWIEERYGHSNPFLMAMAAGSEYRVGDPEERADTETTQRAIDTIANHEFEAFEGAETRALVDESVVGAAAPVGVDPVIVDVQRSAAPVLSVIQSVAQPGFKAKYNTIDARDDPVGMLSETEAAGDLESQFTEQSYTMASETKDMKIQVGLVKVSDFTQRAMETLEYMDPRQTSLGQAVIAHSLFKAKQFFYGDPSTAAADQSIEDGDAYEGLAKMAADAGESVDKSTVSSGFLEDLLDELTIQTSDTAMTWDRAHYLVSPHFYNAVYSEATPVVRIDGYDADVEFGPQGIALSSEMGTVPITPCPNIRSYTGLTGTGSASDPGDVFLIDELATQFRQLAPMFTVPLGRTGLADRVAMGEYGTLIDKAQGNHNRWLKAYDIPTGA